MVACSSLMNPFVARYAKRHQIALRMCATVGERSDMMNKRRKDISALLFAHFTKWMTCQVTITNLAPRAAIPLVLIVAAREVLVVSLHDFLMCLTVTAFSICEIRTSCHSAGTFLLFRHLHLLPSYRLHCIQKEHRRSCAPCFFQFILYHRNNMKIYENFPTTAKLCSALPCNPSIFR